MQPLVDTQRIELVTEVDGVKTNGFAIRRELYKDERFYRALRMFGIFFGIGCFTVFIPILHFILPPLFLIGGSVFAWSTWLESSEVLEGQITCPNCKHTMQLQKEAEEWPKIQRCGACSFMLKTYPEGHHAGQVAGEDNHATGNF